MIILNVPGDFMCVNVMFDTSCEVSDIMWTVPRRSKSWQIDMVKIVIPKIKNLNIRVLRLSLACRGLKEIDEKLILLELCVVNESTQWNWTVRLESIFDFDGKLV